jgi:aryl-alcohol dehydrogenase-like predicted oxidoreductase
VLPACERLGVGFVPYFPLASGLLTGKYRRGEAAPEGARLSSRDQVASDEQFEAVDALQRYAEERGVSLLEVAFGGLLAHPVVSSVIAGATKPEQIAANAAAARWVPGEDDMAALSSVLQSAGV